LQVTISALWMRAADPCDREWIFFLRFAASCVEDEDVATIIEKTLPSELGHVCSEKRGVIESLLVVLDSQ